MLIIITTSGLSIDKIILVEVRVFQ